MNGRASDNAMQSERRTLQIAKCKMQSAKCKMCAGPSFVRGPISAVFHFAFCTLHFTFCILVLSLHTSPAFADDSRKIVVPFDFISSFDNGRYGQMVGDMVWRKLSRERGLILPESMSDVRDYCETHGLKVSPEMSQAKLAAIVRDDFGGQIGVWGSVERVPGTEGDAYDLVLKCVDFSAKPTPKVIYDTKARTKSVSEIPHRYVQGLVDALVGRESGGGQGANPEAEAAWKEKPNLLGGGDFERGEAGVPKGWSARAGQQREPLGALVRWMDEPSDSAAARNKIVRFTLDRNVAENEGVMYYSDEFPIAEGATYRFQCRWRSDGPAVKVFVKCYNDASPQHREVYRSQQNLSGPTGQWNTHSEDFTPRHTRYAPRWGRVMLYAYLKPGTVDFDDVFVKQILGASAAEANKVRRSSSQSKVTIPEMRESE
jgi:hypothetical protein